jgi:integrase/recombinase XerD
MTKISSLQTDVEQPGAAQVAEFLEAHALGRDGFEPNTAATYGHDLQLFFAFALEQYASLNVGQWDERALGEFYVHMRTVLKDDGTKYSPHTIQTYMSAARRYLVWLDAEGRLPRSMSLSRMESVLRERRGKRRTPYRRKRVDPNLPLAVVHYDGIPLPSADTKQARRQRLIVLRNRALMHVLWSTAARIEEVVGLTCNQVQNGLATRVEVVAKGRKSHEVFFDAGAQRAIQAYLRERETQGVHSRWLFVGHRGKPRGHLTRQTAWHIVLEAATAVNLTVKTSPHSIRHYRAQQMLDAGVGPDVVQALLGHADISTTNVVYAAASRETVRQAVAEKGITATEAARQVRARQDEGKAEAG